MKQVTRKEALIGETGAPDGFPLEQKMLGVDPSGNPDESPMQPMVSQIGGPMDYEGEFL